jgi:hypothetical protein
MEAGVRRAKRPGPPQAEDRGCWTSDYEPRLAPFDKKTRAIWQRIAPSTCYQTLETVGLPIWPRRAIDAARAWARGEINMTMVRAAAVNAHAAALKSAHPAAIAAARAAGHPAATAHSIRYARGAAAHAIVSAAASITSRRV